MKDQSHKREMAAALEGDFARLRARGVDSKLGRPVMADGSPELGADAAVDVGGGAAHVPAEPAPTQVRSTWLDRVRGRG